MLAILGLQNLVSVAIITAAVALIFWRRVIGRNNRRATSWVDAWLKGAVILVFFMFVVVFVPSYAMQTKTVAGWDRNMQDVIGSGLFAVGLIAALWGLRRAYRTQRV